MPPDHVGWKDRHDNRSMTIAATWPFSLPSLRSRAPSEWVTRRDLATGKGCTIDYMFIGEKYACAAHNTHGSPVEFNASHDLMTTRVHRCTTSSAPRRRWSGLGRDATGQHSVGGGGGEDARRHAAQRRGERGGHMGHGHGGERARVRCARAGPGAQTDGPTLTSGGT